MSVPVAIVIQTRSTVTIIMHAIKFIFFVTWKSACLACHGHHRHSELPGIAMCLLMMVSSRSEVEQDVVF